MTPNEKITAVALAGGGLLAVSTLVGYVLLVPETPLPRVEAQRAAAPLPAVGTPEIDSAVRPQASAPVPAKVEKPRAPQRPASPPPQPEPVTYDQTPIPIDPALTKQPAALTLAPVLLDLDRYDLRPATFLPWKNYLLGDAKNRSWQQVPWRTTLWDAVVDANEQDKPILLEIHGGNALGRC